MTKRRHLFASAAFLASGLGIPVITYGADSSIRFMYGSYKHIDSRGMVGLVCSIDWEFSLPSEMKQLLSKGISLYFLNEFKLVQSKWIWPESIVAQSRLQIRLSYNPLSRVWCVTRDSITQTFNSLEEAIQIIKHIRYWNVVEDNFIKNNKNHSAYVRISIDHNSLPKPLQINLGNNSALTFDSGWKKIELLH